ncbi:MAG: cobalamin B12-binding domain protein [Thermoanaerobacterales bacterium 50_218]|nr:MAG: cobalamin B12-binding domain protein [Thermoanaerobacterales bacterium 50_218]
MKGETLVNLITELKEKEALNLVKEMLDAGTDPLKVVEYSRAAVEVVGKRFEEGQYFLPELIMAGEIMKGISELLKPAMRQEAEVPRIGKVVIGTVEGDVHDIGKNIVAFLLEANGFQVYDLGVDVPARQFVDKISEVKPQVVGMSCLLTVAFEAMKRTVEAIKEAGLRDAVKIMVGGSPVNEQIAAYVGADAYGGDAQEAVELARKWCGGGK